MDYNAVYHRASDNYCYALNNDELIINLLTGYDVNEVYLIQQDPFENGILGGNQEWSGHRIPIHFKKRLPHQQWWTMTIKPPFKRLQYYFELRTETEVYYYFEDGILDEEKYNLKGRSHQCFIMPWMNPVDVNRVPAWVNDTIWYQIFPERFCNGNHEIDPDNVLPWREEGGVGGHDFFGGDLYGIIQKMDYLKDLGISGIYMTPIMLSNSNHKYDVDDYELIDPHFGNDDTMKQLVREAHAKGIRVMMDGVFNHCGKNFAPWCDVLEKGRNSQYFDWFMINEWPFDYCKGAARKGQYYTFAFIDSMPKLNTNHPEVQEYFIHVCEHWVEKYDIDGIRLDVANEVSHDFCKNLRKALKKKKEDIYILGEIWHDAMPWLRGDEFDSVMNYPLGSSIKDFWIDKKLRTIDFEFTINRCYTRYMQQTNDVLFNLLDSHDTKRLRSEVQSVDEFYCQLAVLMAMPGSPCIYYGTEIGMEGEHDPDCRRCMPWNKIENGVYRESIDTISALLKLRNSQPLLKGRNFHFPKTFVNDRVIHFQKLGWVDNYIEILINCDQHPVSVGYRNQILFEKHYHDGILEPNGILFCQ